MFNIDIRKSRFYKNYSSRIRYHKSSIQILFLTYLQVRFSFDGHMSKYLTWKVKKTNKKTKEDIDKLH